LAANLPITERATLELVKAWGRRGWEVRQAPERSRKKHIDLFLPNIGLSNVSMT